MAGTPCDGCPLYGKASVERPSLESNPGGVFFLGSFPDYGSTVNTMEKRHVPFNGRKTVLLRKMVNSILNTIPSKDQKMVMYGCSCYCTPDFNRNTKRYEISVAEHARCSVYNKDFIDLQKPDVIVAMGTDVYRVLGLGGTVADRRGRPAFYKDKFGREVPVICTFDVGMVAKKPGLVNLFKHDIIHALRFETGAGEVSVNRSIVPMTADGIVEALEHINDLVTNATSVYDRMVAFDTETTSVTPEVLEDRIIAMSFSCENDVGIAFPYQHREVKHSEEDMARIKAAVERVLTNENAIICTANGGFDLKWLWARGIACNEHKWDVMLAEHCLDEDKKGEYSLKDITRLRFPQYGNYESELTVLRNERWAEKGSRMKELSDTAKEETAGRLTAWWIGLESDKVREELLGQWVGKGLVSLSDTAGLSEVKTVKRGGVSAPSKKYLASVVKVLGKLPASELPKEAVVEAEIPEDLSKRSYEDIDIDKLLHYAAMDALVTRLIAEQQYDDMCQDRADMKEFHRRFGEYVPPVNVAFQRITMPLSVELAHMELHGIRFDRDKAKEYQKTINDSTEQVLDSIYTKVGYKFNPNSSADLVKVLYTDMKIEPKAFTDKNSPATNEAALKDLYEEHRELTLIDDLLNYRKLSKTSGTYIANWLEQSKYDGYIHCSFNQTGTATYRLSSSNPNLQNVPFSLYMPDGSMLNLKSLFLPDEGYDLYDMDIKNAEMRVLCAYSNDERLIGAFNSGQDLHSLTASGISGIPYEQICAHKEDKTRPEYTQRQVAKKVNFGTIYCMSAKTLKENLWKDNRIDITEEEAAAYLNGFFATYPGVKEYIERTKKFVDVHHWVPTFFGRRRRLPYSMYMTNDKERIHRQAVNARIQSTSSDIVMSCLIRLNRKLRERNDGSCVLLTVHDSVPFQAPHGAYEHMRGFLDDIIVNATREQCPWLPVDWAYDCSWGANYGDTHGEIG